MAISFDDAVASRRRIQQELTEMHPSSDGDHTSCLEVIGDLRRTLAEHELLEEELETQNAQLEQLWTAILSERHAFRRLFEHAPAAYVVTDGNATIQETNVMAAELVGASPRFLVGKPLAIFVAAEQRSSFRRWAKQLASETEEAVSQRFRLVNRDGGELEVVAWVASTSGADGRQTMRWVLTTAVEDAPEPSSGLPSAIGDGQAAKAVDGGQTRRNLEQGPGGTASSARTVILFGVSALTARALDLVGAAEFGQPLQIVATTDSLDELGRLVHQHAPDLVVVDLSSSSPTSAVRCLGGAASSSLVGFGGSDREQAAALRTGFAAVLPAGADPGDIVSALCAVTSRWVVVPPEALGDEAERVARRQEIVDLLDEEELDIWREIAVGRHDRELAERYFVSPRTMKRRVSALFRKLGVSTRVEAALVAGYVGAVDARDGAGTTR